MVSAQVVETSVANSGPSQDPFMQMITFNQLFEHSYSLGLLALACFFCWNCYPSSDLLLLGINEAQWVACMSTSCPAGNAWFWEGLMSWTQAVWRKVSSIFIFLELIGKQYMYIHDMIILLRSLKIHTILKTNATVQMTFFNFFNMTMENFPNSSLQSSAAVQQHVQRLFWLLCQYGRLHVVFPRGRVVSGILKEDHTKFLSKR